MSLLLPYSLKDPRAQPIPFLDPPQYSIPIQENGERLVAVGPFTKYDKLYCDPIYKGIRWNSSPYALGEIKGSLWGAYMREGIAESFSLATNELPEGYGVLVWEGYRTLQEQAWLFKDYVGKLMRSGGLSRKEALEAAQVYVSMPSARKHRPSPHNTGGCVDFTIIRFSEVAQEILLRIKPMLESDDWHDVYSAELERMQLVREHSAPLNMGTPFDWAMKESSTRFYEEKLERGDKLSDKETEALYNRRLHYYITRKAGLRNYEGEWWHAGKTRLEEGPSGISPYGAAHFSEECHNHERIMRDFFTGNEIMRTINYGAVVSKFGCGEMSDIQRFVWREAQFNGSQRHTTHPKASRLDILAAN